LNLFKLVSKAPSAISCEELLCLEFNGTQAELYIDAPFSRRTPLMAGKVPRFVDLGKFTEQETIGVTLDRFNSRLNVDADLLLVERGVAELAVYSPLIPTNRHKSLLSVLKDLGVYEHDKLVRMYCGKFVKPFDGPVEYQLHLYAEVKLQLISD